MKRLEEQEQEAVFDWAEYIPELRWMHSSINGAFLFGNKIQRARQWKRLKKQGAKTGVWDFFLPLPKAGFHGLYVEMKRSIGTTSVSEDQKEFGAWCMTHGYKCNICYGSEEAIKVIKNYLELK